MNEKDIRDYLNTMFANALDQAAGHLVVWSPQDKLAAFNTDIDRAVDAVTERCGKKFDVYCGLGLIGQAKKAEQRGSADDVSAITSFWCDLDVRGPAHAKKRLPPTLADAFCLLDALQYEPSMIVLSGHGLQAYWCFSEPWVFDGPDDRTLAATSARQWVKLVQAAAGRRGYDLDSVGDLSRVFRVPGTVNWKQPDLPIDVTIHSQLGPVYHSEDLIEEAASAAIAQPVPLPLAVAADTSNGRILLSAHAEPPSEKLDALRQNDRRFDETWTAARKLASASEYDMALANHTVACEWSDQEIVNLLIAGRRKRKDDLKLRLDYYARTIAKARSAHMSTRVVAQAFDRLEEMIDSTPAQTPQDAPQSIETDGAATASDTGTEHDTPQAGPQVTQSTPQVTEAERVALTAVVSKLLGFEIVRWIQRGREPRRAEYSLVLPSGREVLIGRSSSVLRASCFREAILDAVGVVMPGFKPGKWGLLCKAMMRIVDIEENQELYRDHQIREWLRLYIRDVSYFNDDNWTDALANLDPFTRDGDLYVSVQSLCQFLRRALGERLEKSQVYGYLGTIGFKRKQVTGNPADSGQRPSRSYWSGPLAEISGS